MTYQPDLPPPSGNPVSPGPAGAGSTRDAQSQWSFDLITGLLLTGFCGLPYFTRPELMVASFALTLPWIIRRRFPRLALAAATVAALGQLAVGSSLPTLAIIAVPMLIYSYARWSDRRLARIALGIGLVGSILGPLRWVVIGYSTAMVTTRFGVLMMTVLACAGMVSLAYVLGSRRRERAERAAQSFQAQLERERLMAAEQEQRARVAAINERNRIARELHDIVAHSLSVIVVQAEGGRALAVKRPEKAPEVLSTIADTSREALTEMRQMVGLLRSGGALGEPGRSDNYVPTPDLDDLPELVERTAGEVNLREYGARPVVAQALGLTVYRVVQESLTNVLKHAGPSARAAVGITYAPNGIGIRVIDDGRGANATGDGKGHGLRGMRERVALHDGTVQAGPREGGGYEVLVWLPFPPAGAAGGILARQGAPAPVPPAAGFSHPQATDRGGAAGQPPASDPTNPYLQPAGPTDLGNPYAESGGPYAESRAPSVGPGRQLPEPRPPTSRPTPVEPTMVIWDDNEPTQTIATGTQSDAVDGATEPTQTISNPNRTG